MARLERGEVRLYRFTSPDKPRPVVILTRTPSIHLMSTVIVASITSTIRGVPSEVMLDESDGMKKPCCVNLHNLHTIRQHQLGARVAVLSETRMNEICRALHFATGCNP